MLSNFATDRTVRNSDASIDNTVEMNMLRRSFLLALGGLGLSTYTAHARALPKMDFRTADLMGGSFAMQTSQLALARTGNPDVVNFANAEIAEQVQVATALGATPGSAPLRPDHAALLQRLQATPSGGFDRMYVGGGRSEVTAKCWLSTTHTCKPAAIRRSSTSRRCHFRSSSGTLPS